MGLAGGPDRQRRPANAHAQLRRTLALMPACLSAHLRTERGLATPQLGSALRSGSLGTNEGGGSGPWRPAELNSLLALREPQAEPLGGKIDQIQQAANHPTNSANNQRRSFRRDDLLQGKQGQVRGRGLRAPRKDL